MGHYPVTAEIPVKNLTEDVVYDVVRSYPRLNGTCSYSDLCDNELTSFRGISSYAPAVEYAEPVIRDRNDAEDAAHDASMLQGRIGVAAYHTFEGAKTVTVTAKVTDKAIASDGKKAIDDAIAVAAAKVAKGGRWRVKYNSTKISAGKNTVEGGRTDGETVTHYNLAVSDVTEGNKYSPVLHRATYETQAAARQAATDFMGQHPDKFMKAAIVPDTFRRAPSGERVNEVVELTSRPRQVTVTAEIEVTHGNPGVIVAVIDCHH